ncbi:hypothetical protein GCM10010357_36530 [Streptomyces luteireticuli]|uniref:Uncharacterized protein n=1 Tax=Streptomyces luteireticuli TaxID=173858 RepID=A0ABN0YVZ2_9ACTN
MTGYDGVRSVSAKEFERGMPSESDLANESLFTRSDAEDIAKMERLLDLKEGALSRADDFFYLERVVCVCGRRLTVYDLVLTGLIDGCHPRSLVVHTMLGNKRVVNPPRPIRCSNCSRLNSEACYCMCAYRCDQADR